MVAGSQARPEHSALRAFLVGGLALFLALAAPAEAAEKKAKKKASAPPAATTDLSWTGVGSAQYDACIKAALDDPKSGFDRATEWRDTGGGAPAKHCVAVALYALGEYGEAATRLEALANEGKTLPRALRIALLGQSGEAWMAENQYDRAKAVFGAALKLSPNDVGLLMQRSLAEAWSEDYFEAIDDLNKIIDLEPDHADALAFRATAYRYVGSNELAADDVERALKAQPNHLGALLERGILNCLDGDKKEARADWMAVIRLAPESPAAEAARNNLEKLDVKVE